MVRIVIEGKKTFYLNKQLKQEFDTALYAVKYKDQDLVIVIEGDEGSGKSKTSRMVGFYCAQVLKSNFDRDGVKNIHNDIDKYIRTSIEGPKFMVNILDESRKILNRKRSNSKDAVRFTNYLSECRSKNQVHIILLPTYHDLDRYIAQWRMTLCIHMYKSWSKDESVELGGHELHLGNYKLYANGSIMRYLYDLNGFMYPNQFLVRDSFSNVEVLSEKGLLAYEAQKESLVKSKYFPEDAEEPPPPLDDERLLRAFERDNILKNMTIKLSQLSVLVHDEFKWPYKKIADYVGVDSRVLRRWIENATKDITNMKNRVCDEEVAAKDRVSVVKLLNVT